VDPTLFAAAQGLSSALHSAVVSAIAELVPPNAIAINAVRAAKPLILIAFILLSFSASCRNSSMSGIRTYLVIDEAAENGHAQRIYARRSIEGDRGINILLQISPIQVCGRAKTRIRVMNSNEGV